MASPVLPGMDGPKISDLSPSQIQKNANFLAQLETMMSAVKKEAAALDSMKQKLKDMEELKMRYTDIKGKFSVMESECNESRKALKESEQLVADLRNDMQQLNDIYNTDRLKHIDLQQQFMRVEQELSGVKLEKDFFLKESQKIPELNKTIKTLKNQLGQLKKANEDEREDMMNKTQEFEKKAFLLEKTKEEALQQTAATLEEMEQLKRELVAAQQLHKDILVRMQEEKQQVFLAKTRLTMTSEDLIATRVLRSEAQNRHKQETSQLKGDLQNTKLSLVNRSDELLAVQKALTAAELRLEQLRADGSMMSASNSTLHDSLRDMGNKNQELVRDNMSLKQKLSAKLQDIERLHSESETARNNLSQLEMSYLQREAELASSVKALTAQKDDLAFKLQSMTAQFEAAQAQSKTDQSRHWEEQQRLKQTEEKLLNEAERLNTELQELTVKLHAAQSERVTVESSVRAEAFGANQMVTALKEELEKRLEEMVQLKKERETMRGDLELLEKNAVDMKGEMQKAETLFKRTLESDRQKMKAEMNSRMNKIRQLEEGKAELLRENEQLMRKVEDQERELKSIRSELAEAVTSVSKLNEQRDLSKARSQELLGELKHASKQEEEYRLRATAIEAGLRETIAKLETQLKESKKAASLQVVELNSQMKSLCEDSEVVKKERDTLQESERRLQQELERVKGEHEAQYKKFMETQAMLTNDLNKERMEMQEMRNKSKISTDNRTRLEMEMITLRNDMARTESDLVRSREAYREMEGAYQAAQENLRNAKATIDSISETTKKVQYRVAELDDTIFKKDALIEQLQNELGQLEHDGLMEVRRLRSQINLMEQELSSLRPMIPLLEKEIADNKLSYAKLQGSNSSATSKLLEDISQAEEALSKERRRFQVEEESHRARLLDMQTQLDRSREQVEELQARIKNDKNDKDVRTIQVENELERQKQLSAGKDTRIEELEKQRQSDRLKLHESKDKIDSLERELLDVKTSLELEQQHRKRLENKIRNDLSTAERESAFMMEGGGAGGGGREYYGSGGNSVALYDNGASRGISRGGAGERFTERLKSNPSFSSQQVHRLASNDHEDDGAASLASGRTGLVSGNPYSSHGGTYGGSFNNLQAASTDLTVQHHMHSSRSMPAGMSSSNADSYSVSTDPYSSSNGPRSPFKSPRNRDFSQPSPATERVSAHLANMAQADNSKSFLKNAQQQRNAERAPFPSPAFMNLQQQQSAFAGNGRRPLSAAKLDDDPFVESYNIPGAAAPSYSMQQQQQPLSSQVSSMMSSSNSSSDPIQEQILRTQKLLDRRANVKNLNLPPADSGAAGAGASKDKTPNSGRSAAKLSEVISQGHALYPQQHNHSGDDSADDEVLRGRLGIQTPHLSAPSLHPASPPTVYGGLGRGGAGMGGEGDDDDADDDYIRSSQESDLMLVRQGGPATGGKRKKGKKSADATQLPKLGATAKRK